MEEVLSICSNRSASLNKMATMPIYGKKHFKNLFLQNGQSFKANLGIKHLELRVYQVCSNDDPRLTFDLLMGKSDLHPYAFVW